ncbi:hypothetical protein [Streptomyces sp. NBC_00658]|uniref:hypothetical protein n=1 Tax=Streptomyces sp. NBC_00658 TaxID=2975800 RepID=UPI00324B1138
MPEVVPVPVRRRRRGRTTLLIAAAAVLGLGAGTCAGFLIQADREPTKLPSLSQPVLTQAKGEGPEPLSAAQDRQVKTDGDLRKLLLAKPKGAKEADWLTGDGWMDIAEYADMFEKPDGAFEELAGEEFRRVAETGWSVGSTYTVDIRLVQYRQEEYLAAAEAADDGHYWAQDEEGTDSWAIPGTRDGMAYVHTKADTEPGYLPLYGAEAHAYRGDIAVEIWVYDTKPISKAKIMDLAERQVGRL